jgi:hypothetical protein
MSFILLLCMIWIILDIAWCVYDVHNVAREKCNPPSALEEMCSSGYSG